MSAHEERGSSPIGGILQKALTEVMFVTIAAPGSRDHARPMQVAQLDDDASLWFIAPLDGAALGEAQDGNVTTRVGTRWLRMTGRFEVQAECDPLRASMVVANDDHATLSEEGAVVLLHFTPDSAELWDTSAASGASRLVEAVHGCRGVAA